MNTSLVFATTSPAPTPSPKPTNLISEPFTKLSIPMLFLPVIAVAAVFLLTALFLAVWWRRRQTFAGSSAKSIKRTLEAQDTSLGAQVWFSRQIHRGQWRSWSLIIGDKRYELKEQASGEGQEPTLLFQISPCSLATELQQAADDVALLHTGYRGFYVCLIGWTRKNHADLVKAGEKVMGMLDDDVFERCCQGFLRGLAERICEPKKATDWGWFKENVTCEPHDVEARLMAGPSGPHGKMRPRSVMRLMPMSSVDAGVRSWAYS